ncbi:hypothetical protein ACJX0J_006100, partial [Zea mays]
DDIACTLLEICLLLILTCLICCLILIHVVKIEDLNDASVVVSIDVLHTTILTRRLLLTKEGKRIHEKEAFAIEVSKRSFTLFDSHLFLHACNMHYGRFLVSFRDAAVLYDTYHVEYMNQLFLHTEIQLCIICCSFECETCFDFPDFGMLIKKCFDLAVLLLHHIHYQSITRFCSTKTTDCCHLRVENCFTRPVGVVSMYNKYLVHQWIIIFVVAHT